MSLTGQQQEQTAAELRANHELSGLSTADLQQLTGWTLPRLTAALDLREADPADVWRLRDVLERAAVAAGHTPVPYSVLTERARTAAAVWFGIKPTAPGQRAR